MARRSARVRQRVTAGVAEHVDVEREADLGFLAQRLTNRFMASRVNGAPRSPTLRHLVSGIMRNGQNRNQRGL
jgi:hypothetical protein